MTPCRFKLACQIKKGFSKPMLNIFFGAEAGSALLTFYRTDSCWDLRVTSLKSRPPSTIDCSSGVSPNLVVKSNSNKPTEAETLIRLPPSAAASHSKRKTERFSSTTTRSGMARTGGLQIEHSYVVSLFGHSASPSQKAKRPDGIPPGRLQRL